MDSLSGKERGNSYSAAVFDLDGTLIQLPIDWGAVRDDLAPLLGMSLERKSIFVAIDEATSPNSDARRALFDIIDSHEVAHAERATLIEGATSLLSSIPKGFRVALVTMQGRAVCTMVLGRLGLAGFFEEVFTREDSLDRSEQLLLASRSLHVEPSTVLFVGDKLSDLEAGRKLGAKVALVGKRAREEWGPDYFFRELSEMQLFSK